MAGRFEGDKQFAGQSLLPEVYRFSVYLSKDLA
jgi:hypothetical protein